MNVSSPVICKVCSMADEKTGYCKPPKKHRFKKGQSGNPDGRPRKALSPAALDDAEIIRRLDALIIRVGNREITWREAELRKIQEQAFAGTTKAMRLWEKLQGLAPPPRRGGVLQMPTSFFGMEEFDAKSKK